MPMLPEVRALRTQLLKAAIARQLVDHGVAPKVADEIAATGTYDAIDGQILVDFDEGRATENHQDITGIVEKLAFRSPTPSAEPPVVDRWADVRSAF